MYEEYERESYRLLQEQIAQIPGDRLPHQVRHWLHKNKLYFVQCMIFCRRQFCGSGSGIRCFFDPRIREGKKCGSGIRDEHPRSFSESLETVRFWAKNTLFLWCGSVSGILKTFDPGSGMEKFGSGIRYNPRSATLVGCYPCPKLTAVSGLDEYIKTLTMEIRTKQTAKYIKFCWFINIVRRLYCFKQKSCSKVCFGTKIVITLQYGLLLTVKFLKITRFNREYVSIQYMQDPGLTYM